MESPLRDTTRSGRHESFLPGWESAVVWWGKCIFLNDIEGVLRREEFSSGSKAVSVHDCSLLELHGLQGNDYSKIKLETM